MSPKMNPVYYKVAVFHKNNKKKILPPGAYFPINSVKNFRGFFEDGIGNKSYSLLSPYYVLGPMLETLHVLCPNFITTL